MKNLIWIVLLFSSLQLEAQNTHLRFTFTADIGSQFQRGGVLFQASYLSEKNRIEVFSGVQLKYAIRGYGPQKKSTELILHGGSSLGLGNLYIGNENYDFLPFTLISPRGRKYKIGYTYNHYFDKHDTSQGTGTITLKFNDLYLISENDIFGNLTGLDRYRTGAIGLYWRKDDFYIGAKTVLWTGETRCPEMERVKSKNFPGRYGYKNISHCKYAHLSHGIASIEAGYFHSNLFMPSISIGKDDERIRNFVQNEIIHDMDFIPEKWNGAQNLHIPMIDKKGNPYLYKKDQEIKNGKWFLQLATNHGWFY